MKRSILMLLVIAVAIIFFGCEKMDPLVPDSSSDQEISALKAAKVKRTFEGICTPVDYNPPEINLWYDDTDDWRVTGTTLWVQPDPNIFKGTATLTVDAKNPHDVDRGIWEMTWSLTLVLNAAEDGFDIVAKAEGVGVEGKVKGMKAHWIYTMNYIGMDFPNTENPTFFYTVEGNIEKPQGPIKKD